jgi:hypothetical protein
MNDARSSRASPPMASSLPKYRTRAGRRGGRQERTGRHAMSGRPHAQRRNEVEDPGAARVVARRGGPRGNDAHPA